MVTFDRSQLLLPSRKKTEIMRMKKRAQLLLVSSKRPIIMKHNKSHSLLVPIFKKTYKHTRETSTFGEQKTSFWTCCFQADSKYNRHLSQ